MLDFGDFSATMLESGSAGRGWRSLWAVLGVFVGMGVGGYLGYVFEGPLAILVAAPVGGFFGWLLAIFLRGLLFFLIPFVLILAVVLLLQYLGLT